MTRSPMKLKTILRSVLYVNQASTELKLCMLYFKERLFQLCLIIFFIVYVEKVSLRGEGEQRHISVENIKIAEKN